MKAVSIYVRVFSILGFAGMASSSHISQQLRRGLEDSHAHTIEEKEYTRGLQEAITIEWSVQSYEDETAEVGDTVTFQWTGTHNVHIHPSSTCDETDAILIGNETGASYTFVEDDAGNDIFFACDIGLHCENEQIVRFSVEQQQEDTPESVAPSLQASPEPTPLTPVPVALSDAPSGVPTSAPADGSTPAPGGEPCKGYGQECGVAAECCSDRCIFALCQRPFFAPTKLKLSNGRGGAGGGASKDGGVSRSTDQFGGRIRGL